MINSLTLVNALNKALDTSEATTGNWPAEIRLLYQDPARSPIAITFVGDSEIHCASRLIAKGQRINFSGSVPPQLATGTFYAIPSSVYGNDPTSHFFRVATTMAEAEISDYVEFPDGAYSGFLFDLDITAQDTRETLETYQVTAIAPVQVTKTSTTYNATTKKAVAVYGQALFNGGQTSTPISHTLTFFGGIPGQTSSYFFDLTPATQPAISAGGSLTVVVSIEAEAVAS